MQESDLGRKFLNCATMGDLCEVFGRGQQYKDKQEILGSQERPDKEFSTKVTKESREGTRKRKIGKKWLRRCFVHLCGVTTGIMRAAISQRLCSCYSLDRRTWDSPCT